MLDVRLLAASTFASSRLTLGHLIHNEDYLFVVFSPTYLHFWLQELRKAQKEPVKEKRKELLDNIGRLLADTAVKVRKEEREARKKDRQGERASTTEREV